MSEPPPYRPGFFQTRLANVRLPVAVVKTYTQQIFRLSCPTAHAAEPVIAPGCSCLAVNLASACFCTADTLPEALIPSKLIHACSIDLWLAAGRQANNLRVPERDRPTTIVVQQSVTVAGGPVVALRECLHPLSDCSAKVNSTNSAIVESTPS